MNPLANVLPSMGGLASFAAVAVLVFVVMRMTGLAKSGQSPFQIARIARVTLEAPVRWAIKPALWLFFRVPKTKALADLFWARLTDASLERFFDRVFGDNADPLKAGDLEAVAQQRYPKERYPHLWMTDIPEDLERPLVIDGRLPDGSSPASLAPAFVDTELVGQAYRRAVLAGLFWLAAGLAIWQPQLYFGGVAEAPARGAGQASTAGVQLYEDVWDQATQKAKLTEQAELQTQVLENRRAAIAASAPNGTLTVLAFAMLVFLGTWRGLVRDAAQQKIEPLRRQNKESVLTWKYRLPERDMQYRAYLAQLQVIKDFDHSPVVDLGHASGMFRFRGQLSAPEKGQPMRYSLTDMAQHTLLLGGTGEGKTRTIIKPVVAQLLALRAQAKDKRAISFYCTDGKAVLWRDIKETAEKAGQGEDVRVIGCDADRGEYGVDLMEGVEPQLLADIVASVMRQVSASAGDASDFWPAMASDLIRNSAVIARAWECTDNGMERLRQTGERIYSLVTIYHLAVDEELQERAVRAILDALQDDAQWPYIAAHATAELMDAIRYMRGPQWMHLANDTKSGIIANTRKALAPFASSMRLRAAFASGAADRLISIDQAWGSICLVNISALEYGVAGRVVNVMLKTLLYTEARQREMTNPQIGHLEKMVFIADEFQDLITADVAGMSDSNFWNVARSAGAIGFISTQGMASLEQAVGRIAAENFALQMRSKIFLRVEDPSTMQYAKTLAGKALRSYTFEAGRHESYEALVRETGHDPLTAGPARLVELPDNYLGALASGWSQVHRAALPVSFDTWRAAFDVDRRFIPSGSMFSGAGDTRLAAEQAAAWRQEDKALSYMSEGTHEADVLRDEDIVGMGRAHAYVYLQRAGAARQDLVEIG